MRLLRRAVAAVRRALQRPTPPQLTELDGEWGDPPELWLDPPEGRQPQPPDEPYVADATGGDAHRIEVLRSERDAALASEELMRALVVQLRKVRDESELRADRRVSQAERDREQALADLELVRDQRDELLRRVGALPEAKRGGRPPSPSLYCGRCGHRVVSEAEAAVNAAARHLAKLVMEAASSDGTEADSRGLTAELQRAKKTSLEAGDGIGETTETIYAWSLATFGPVNPVAKGARANLEMAELLRELMFSGAPDAERVLDEIADVVIVLASLAHHFGGDVWVAVERKMAVNRRRRWRIDGDGVGSHLDDIPLDIGAPG